MKKITNVVILLVCTLLCCGGLAAEPRQIIVAQDGTGQFKSISEAVESIKDATKDNPVDIKIKPGDYVETVTTRDWVNLIGENRDACVIRYDGGNDTATVKTHTIWATSNTTLRNLTIVGIRVKYCIHSDGGGKFILNIENCTLRREYPEGDPKTYSAAFGIGLHGDQHIIMKDCLVAADLPVYLHNWNDQRAPCSMTLEKCVLKGKEYAIGIYCLGSKQCDFFVMHDCVLEALEAGIKYVNQNNIKGAPSWNGQSEIELLGSGNSDAKITGVELKNDSRKRQSGIELAAQARAVKKTNTGIRLEERYGTTQERLQKSKVWSPVKIPGPYGLFAEYTEDCLTLICPSEQDNPQPFGYAVGPSGPLIDMPMMMEMRMKSVFGTKGKLELFYCLAPDAWIVEWLPDGIVDSNNREARIAVNTTAWQTYRLIARNPDDVRLFVDGVSQGIVLKKVKSSATYLQFRVHGHGNKAMIDSFLLTGTLPAEKP